MSDRLPVRAAIRRQSGRNSTVDHLCKFEHRYGPRKQWVWLSPICGAEAGRKRPVSTGELCAACKRAAGGEV